MARRDHVGRQGAYPPRRVEVGDERLVRRLRLTFQIEQRIGRDPLQEVVVGEQHARVGGPEADQPRSMSGQMQHLGGESLEPEDGAGGERLDLLERPGHAQRVLPVDLHVLEQVGRRSQPGEVRPVPVEPLLRPVAAGELVVVAEVRVDGSAGSLLRGARIAVMVDVPVADEDAAHLAEGEAELVEAGVERVAAILGADARVEERDAAALLLDDVHVRRPTRLGERDRNRDPVHAEAGQGMRHLSFFTSSVSSGSALNRSPTRP